MNTIVIANQKGGVGKSTLTALLAWWLAEKRKARVALIDLDSQKNLTRTFAQQSNVVTAARLFRVDLSVTDMILSALCLFQARAN